MARFARTIFMNTPQDCAWLRDTHLKGVTVPSFASFTLTGNEDAPSCLELYVPTKPEYNTQPCATVEPGEAGMVVTLAAPAKKK